MNRPTLPAWTRSLVLGFLLMLSTVLVGAAQTYKDGVQYPLNSKKHTWVMYESRTRTMTVESVQGGVYEHYDVPYEVFKGFIEARLKIGYHRTKIEKRFTVQRLSK